MSHAAFRLESFAAPDAPSPEATRDAVDSAYQKGLTDGRIAAASAALSTLSAALNDISAQLSDAEAQRSATRLEAITDMLPLVHEVVTTLADTGGSTALETAIIQELRKIVAETPALECRIDYAPELEDLIRRCLELAGSPPIRLQPCLDCEGASITLEGGRIAFSKTRAAARIRELICELEEDFR